jgi:hypothetical protein
VKPKVVLSVERRVAWLYGQPRPSSAAFDNLMEHLYGAVAGPLSLDNIPHVLPYTRSEQLQLLYVTSL